MHYLIKILLIITISLMISCGSGAGDSEKKEKKLRITNEEIIKKFNSTNNPGKWKNLDENHVPIYKINKTKSNIKISATAPFKNTQGHYVEFILLLDSSYKEIAKKSFKKGSEKTDAVFLLPKNSKGEFFLVLKCNLHDMWMERILLQ